MTQIKICYLIKRGRLVLTARLMKW